MPRVGQRTTAPAQRQHDDKIARALAAVEHWEEFRKVFQRSRRGNLWAKMGDEVLSVFARKDGSFGWSVATEDGPTFSQETYTEEEDALQEIQNEE